MTPSHFVSPTCTGEKCKMCGNPATHKIGEEVPMDDPRTWTPFHNMTSYICCFHFNQCIGGRCIKEGSPGIDNETFWVGQTRAFISKLTEGWVLKVKTDDDVFWVGMAADMTLGYVVLKGIIQKISPFDPIHLHILHGWVKKYEVTVVSLDEMLNDVG